MKLSSSKLSLSVLSTLLIAGSVLSTASRAHADAYGTKPAPVFQAGDHVVVNFRLSGFDPAQFAVRGSKTLARNLAETEITHLEQRALLTRHALGIAAQDARGVESLNPLLKNRAMKAAEKVSDLSSDLAKITIELERMQLLKGAARGKTLSALDIERIRLHDFNTLRSVSDANAVGEIAQNAVRKEASMFGARVSSIEKFSSGAWGKAVELQRKTKMRLLGGAAVAGGIVAFVLYSDFETERTEERLTTTEYLPE